MSLTEDSLPLFALAWLLLLYCACIFIGVSGYCNPTASVHGGSAIEITLVFVSLGIDRTVYLYFLWVLLYSSHNQSYPY